jgi:hypothetical protein
MHRDARWGWREAGARLEGRLDLEESWTKIVAAAAAGKPGTIKGRLFSDDKSQRYKQLSDILAGIDRACPAPRLSIDGWLSKIDGRHQLLPESAVHDLEWNSSAEVAVGTFELHVGARR